MSVCPFCGVATEAPHENQQGCLDALSAEIARLRAVLEQVQSTAVPGPVEEDRMAGRLEDGMAGRLEDGKAGRLEDGMDED
jgi:hypothetical protein